jgi:hypothetical protein
MAKTGSGLGVFYGHLGHVAVTTERLGPSKKTTFGKSLGNLLNLKSSRTPAKSSARLAVNVLDFFVDVDALLE